MGNGALASEMREMWYLLPVAHLLDGTHRTGAGYVDSWA